MSPRKKTNMRAGDPRVPGGSYFDGYWREGYLVEAMWSELNSPGFPVYRVRWVDGRVTEHCTLWEGRDGVLTERQLAILRAVHRSMEQRGFPPSPAEIGEAVGLTGASGVVDAVNELRRLGCLPAVQARPRLAGH